MTSELVEILLRARNEASAGLKKVESDLQRLDKAVSKSLFSTGFDMKGNFLGAKDFAKEALPALNAQIEKWVIMGASVEEITDTLLPDYIKKLNTAGGAAETSVTAAKRMAAAFAALGGVMALQQAGRFAVEMAQLNTQIERSTFAFEHFSGGAAQAGANLRAVQRASGGMLTTLEAQNIAVVAMTQGLADNSQELERMTRIARGIVSVSPIINDLETAFSQLGLTIANQSMMRLDQLGTSAAEIKPKIEALKAANKDLTDEQAFQAALLGTLETKFASLTGAAVNQASGMERLSVAWKEYRNSASGAFAWVDSMMGAAADALDQQTKFDFGKWLADQIGNPDFMGELTYAQKQIASKIRELTDLSYLDKLKMGDQYSIQIAALVDQYFKLGDAAARAADLMSRPLEGPNLPTFFTGADWSAQVEKNAEAAAQAQETIDKMIEARARAVQQSTFARTGDFNLAQDDYRIAIEDGNRLLQIQQDMGRNAHQLIPVFDAMLASFVSPDAVDAVDAMRDSLWDMIETLARAEQREFVLLGGDALESVKVYESSLESLRDILRSGDFNLGDLEDLKTLLTVMPAMLEAAGNAAAAAGTGFDILADGIRNALSAAGKVGTAVTGVTQGIAGTVTDVLSSLADMTSGMEMDLFGIGADFGGGLEGGRKYVAEMLPDVQQMVLAWAQNGATLEEITQILLPNYLSDLESANASLYRTEKGTAAVNDEFNSLKSTISGIVSGAIGPVAGVDANDLLPREDAVNENARRLADIAVNGFKGQEWLDEFAMEAPDVFEQLKNSSDPKATAAQILKDFQDGLVPELLDKDRAKELVKRALQGDANTKQLVDEIAGELASELGISLSEAKATASEVLGGGEGATGVSLAPKIDATAAESAASAFASSFNAAISGSTIGADLSGTIMTQVMASVAVIEASGNEAGKALVKGVTATFTDIPAAFIAAVAALVTPAVQASINQNGGRTGAAAV